MFLILRKHLSFALLMAFVIGWSGVVAAQQNIIHQQMMNEMINAQYTSQNTKTDIVSAKQQGDSAHILSDCHQPLVKHNVIPSHYQTAELEHTTTQAAHCDEMNLQSQSNMEQMDCQDCALWHCQFSTSLIDAALVNVQAVSMTEYHDVPKFIYTAQHLKGHWQEILRPPQI